MDLVKCSHCHEEYYIELEEIEQIPADYYYSIYNCPNCKATYYIREILWLKSIIWKGLKFCFQLNEKKNSNTFNFNIELNAKKLYAILNNKGIDSFYHANTVCTSKTFIDNNALLSRQYIEENNLNQTEQKSDEKQYEISQTQ